MASDAVNKPEYFVIPGLPPTTNHAYRVSVRGGKAIMYKSVEAKAWQEAAVLIINTQKERQDWSTCGIRVGLTFFCNNMGRDIDGGIKLALDAIAEGLGFNDKKVLVLVVHKGKTVEQEETCVEVWSID